MSGNCGYFNFEWDSESGPSTTKAQITSSWVPEGTVPAFTTFVAWSNGAPVFKNHVTTGRQNVTSTHHQRIQGALEARVPLAPQKASNACSFKAILKEKPLFWANCGLRASPLGSKLCWAHPWPKSWSRPWTHNYINRWSCWMRFSVEKTTLSWLLHFLVRLHVVTEKETENVFFSFRDKMVHRKSKWIDLSQQCNFIFMSKSWFWPACARFFISSIVLLNIRAVGAKAATFGRKC